MAKRGHLIWISGFPAVGKYTVARELQRRLPDSVLIDNHSLIDQVTLARDHPDYNDERMKVRDAAHRRWVYPASDAESECGDREEQLRRAVILTDFFTVSKVGNEWSMAVKAAAEQGGRPFLPVYLTCAREENLKRLVSEERLSGERKKLTDVELVSQFMDDSVPFRFEGIGLEVDVTKLSPGEVAERILEALK